MTDAYALLLQDRFPWERWERLILSEGILLDRPRETPHPRYPDIIYPMDYGFIRNTISSDGSGVDVFVGSGLEHLVGMIITRDYRQGDREIKFLWRCLPTEIYLAHGFINFDPSKLKGRLILRFPMKILWELQEQRIEHSENLP